MLLKTQEYAFLQKVRDRETRAFSSGFSQTGSDMHSSNPPAYWIPAQFCLYPIIAIDLQTPGKA